MEGNIYTAKTLMRLFGLTRNTLRYYEQLGLIAPQRMEGSDYRLYSNRDVSHIFSYMMMKNTGGTVSDAQDTIAAGDATSRLVEACLENNSRKLAWHRALDESLRRIEECRARIREGAARLCMLDAWRIYFDGNENGFKAFDSNEAQDALLACYPIASLGSLRESGPNGQMRRFGRTILDRHAELVDSLPKASHYQLIGNVPCVAFSVAVPADDVLLADADCRDEERFPDVTARRYHCELSGTVFSVGTLSDGVLWVDRYAMVRPRDLIGVLILRRLRRVQK